MIAMARLVVSFKDDFQDLFTLFCRSFAPLGVTVGLSAQSGGRARNIFGYILLHEVLECDLKCYDLLRMQMIVPDLADSL